MRILLVDDEPELLEIYTTLLLELSAVAKIHHACNGQYARELISQQQPDMIITDLRMPAEDGETLLRWSIQNAPQTPVIVVSASAEFGAEERCLKLGAASVLNKPLDFDIFLQVVQKCIKGIPVNQTSNLCPIVCDKVQ